MLSILIHNNMEIKNIKVYGLEESIIRSGYPHQISEPADLYNGEEDNKLIHGENSLNRAKRLSNTPTGSGHNNFLKGIIVQFDLKYPQYFTPQLQRYHWIDIISSQSKMHSLTKIKDIKNSCNKYVEEETIDNINLYISNYNRFIDGSIKEIHTNNLIITTKEEYFQYIISNLPMGFELWMGISTNYLQLKTIYNQRKAHKLEDWKYFCNWIESLPLKNLIIS